MTNLTANVTVESFDASILVPIFKKNARLVKSQDQEEVWATATLRILEEINKGTVITSIKSFCGTIISRTIADYYRYNNRMISRSSTSVNFCDNSEEESRSGADAFYVAIQDFGYSLSEVRSDYEANMVMFTPRERTILDYMLYEEDALDMIPTEVARTVGLDRSHASNAVRKLKKLCQV